MTSSRTQVIHAPLFEPNAISQAGSSDWKYSSGWKKVRMLSAFKIRNAIRNKRISCDLAASFTCWNALLWDFSSSCNCGASLSNAVEACDSAGEAIPQLPDSNCNEEGTSGRQQAAEAVKAKGPRTGTFGSWEVPRAKRRNHPEHLSPALVRPHLVYDAAPLIGDPFRENPEWRFRSSLKAGTHDYCSFEDTLALRGIVHGDIYISLNYKSLGFFHQLQPPRRRMRSSTTKYFETLALELISSHVDDT